MNNVVGPQPERVGSAAAADLASAALRDLIARLSANLDADRVGYWASYADDRHVERFSFVSDPAFARLSDENAASRALATQALAVAIERYRARLLDLGVGRTIDPP